MVAVAIIGVVAIALYTGLAYGFSSVQLSRENLRATQILIEKAETIRLYTWTQITTSGYIPKDFTATYDPTGTGSGQGVLYEGKVEVKDSNLSANYDDDVKVISVTLEWKNGKKKRERSLTTLVGRYGLQNYVY